MSTALNRFSIYPAQAGQAVLALKRATADAQTSQDNLLLYHHDLACLARDLDAYLGDPRAAMVHRAPDLYLYADPEGEVTLELRGSSGPHRYTTLAHAELRQLSAALNEYLTPTQGEAP
jgi:hypothetical protein